MMIKGNYVFIYVHFFISLNPNTKHFQFPSEKLAKFILQTYFCVKISFILHFY
jgi:hypothetical protein